MQEIEQLKSLVKEKGLKYYDLARLTGLTVGYIHNLVNKPDIFRPSPKALAKIRNGLQKYNKKN